MYTASNKCINHFPSTLSLRLSLLDPDLDVIWYVEPSSLAMIKQKKLRHASMTIDKV